MGDDDRDGKNPNHVAPRMPVDAEARDRGRVAWLIIAVVMAAYAWWAVALPPFSGRATAAVVLGGALAMVVGARQQRRRSQGTGDTPGIAAWAALAVAAGAWQLAAYLQHPRADHPTLSSLANEALDSHLARAAAFVVWIAVAWGLARR
jgi:hypothetical protein